MLKSSCDSWGFLLEVLGIPACCPSSKTSSKQQELLESISLWAERCLCGRFPFSWQVFPSLPSNGCGTGGSWPGRSRGSRCWRMGPCWSSLPSCPQTVGTMSAWQPTRLAAHRGDTASKSMVNNTYSWLGKVSSVFFLQIAWPKSALVLVNYKIWVFPIFLTLCIVFLFLCFFCSPWLYAQTIFVLLKDPGTSYW